MKFLICEGICNGGVVQEMDAQIRKHKRIESGDKDGPGRMTSVTAVPGWVLEQIRRFIYTAHRWVGADEQGYGRYECTHCHMVRRY